MSDVPMSLNPVQRCPIRWVLSVLSLGVGLLLSGLTVEADASQALKATERSRTPARSSKSTPRPLPQPIASGQGALQFIVAAEGRTLRHPVRVDRIDAEVEIVGLRASTRLTLDWTALPAAESGVSPADEGALWVPLSGDQQVTAVSVQTLDQPVRPAVALGARQLPALATTGPVPTDLPSFRLALHPWWSSAGSDPGTRQGRRVVLQIEQTLASVTAARPGSLWSWTLPIEPESGPCPVRVQVVVHDEQPARGPARVRPLRWLNATAAAGPVSRSGTTVWTWQHPSHRGPVGLQLAVPEHTVISQGTQLQQTFVYAEVPFADWVHPRRVRPEHGPKARPMALIWDASATRALSDHGRELELIDRWLGRLDRSERLEIDLYLGRERAEPVGHFRVGSGNWAALRRALEQVSYAGIGLPQAWKVPAGADQVLLFSDGLEPDPLAPEAGHAVPAGRTGPVLHAVLASAQADEMRLRRLAEASGGRLIDLLRQSPDAAAADLVRAVPRIVSIRSKGLRDLHIVSRRPELGRLVLAAAVAHPEDQPLKAQATLVLRWPGGDTEERVIDFSRASVPHPEAGAGAGPADLATQRWLALQMRSLNEPAQRERLARRHGVGVPAQRMVVLAQAADYARLRLPPPDVGSLRADYQRARNQPTEAPRGWPQRQERIEQLWERPAGKKDATSPGAEAAGADAMPSAWAEMVLRARLSGSPLSTQDDDWIERLRLSLPATRDKVLAEEQRRHAGRAIFPLVAADLMFGLGEPVLAVRTLSTLMDVDLEEPGILRAVVLRLLAHQQPELAALAARRWSHQRPDQAEAWYWLAQAQSELGQIDEAFASLDQGLIQAPRSPGSTLEPRPDGVEGLQPDLAPLILDEMQALSARAPHLHSFHQLEQSLPVRPAALRIQLSSDAGMLSRLRWVTPAADPAQAGEVGECPGGPEQTGSVSFGTPAVGTEQLCRIGSTLSAGRHELWLDPGSQWPLPLALARVRLVQGRGAAQRELSLWVDLHPGQPQRLAVIEIDEHGAIRTLEADAAAGAAPAASPQIPRLSEPTRSQL